MNHTPLEERDGTLWWDRIAFIPSIHGRAAFARETRRVFLGERFATVAVELPESLADRTLEGIELLPAISVVSYEEEDGTRCFFPIDPCDSIIEALRLGAAENCELAFIDCDVESFERRTVTLPDPYAVRSIGLSRYYRTVEVELPRSGRGSQDDQREHSMAVRLHELLRRNPRYPILCVIGMSHLPGIVRHLERLRDGPEADSDRQELLQALPPFRIDLHALTENSLYHILGEFPYVTHLWEEQRRAITLEEFDSTQKLKELLQTARERFHRKHPEDDRRVSTGAFQNLLKLIRNLCLLQKRLTPSLYEIVLAARGIGGNEFALEVIGTAKSYPPLAGRRPEPTSERDAPRAGADPDTAAEEAPGLRRDVEARSSASLPEPSGCAGDDAEADMTEEAMRAGGEVFPAKKRYVDESKEWKRLRLTRPPSKEERERWRTAWNPYETCSWEPEDQLIENFASHVRHKAIQECLAQERIEEFTTSFKDGLHIRETLRNVHLGKIFVKEVPPVHGQVGAVVVIYEKPDPVKFPWKLTWFSEHEWESTLSFYATDYREHLVGPGIGRALYGGQLFIYPPRLILDVWDDPTFRGARDDEERLVFAGLFHSRQRFVACVAPGPPTLRMKAYAERLGRRLLYLPLSSFSRSTIRKLRRFHVLNGKPVRGYARQFIR